MHASFNMLGSTWQAASGSAERTRRCTCPLSHSKCCVAHALPPCAPDTRRHLYDYMSIAWTSSPAAKACSARSYRAASARWFAVRQPALQWPALQGGPATEGSTRRYRQPRRAEASHCPPARTSHKHFAHTSKLIGTASLDSSESNGNLVTDTSAIHAGVQATRD